MIVKLLAEHYLEFISLKGGCRGLSESTLVKMSNCWKSHVHAHIFTDSLIQEYILNASKNATFTVQPYSRFNAILSF